MADKKISALTGASTPLAGTEVLPIVQSGATVKVAVSDLTAGRAVSASKLTTTNAVDIVVENIINQPNALYYSALTLQNSGASGKTYQLSLGGNTSGQPGNFYVYNATSGAIPLVVDGTTNNVSVGIGNLVIGTAAKGVNFTANTPAAGMTSQLLNWYEEGTFTPTIASDAGSVTLSTAVGKYTRIGRQVTINANVTVSASTASANVYLATLPFTPSSNGSGSIYGSSFTLDVTPMLAIDSGSTLVNIQRTNGLGSVATLGPRLQAGTVMYFSLTYFV